MKRRSVMICKVCRLSSADISKPCTLGVFAERIGRQLFKLAVEQNVNNHILASDTDIDAARYMKMHALSMDQVRGTNGKISFVDVLQQEKAL